MFPRLLPALRLDVLAQKRYGFYYAAVFVTLVWVALLYPLPDAILDLAVPLVIFADLAVIGYYFVAGIVLFEKGEDTLSALVTTPLRFREYLASKLATLTGLAVMISLVVALAGSGFDFDPILLLAGVILISLVSLLVGFITVAPFASISDYLIPSSLVITVLGLPIFHFLGFLTSPLFYLLPTQGPMLLLGGAFDPGLDAWQVAYAVFYPLLWVFGLCLVARRAFDRYVVERRGG
jgi:fluoroquinolone transport system permease protein